MFQAASVIGRQVRVAALMTCLAAPLPYLFDRPATFDDVDMGGLPEIRSVNGELNATLVAVERQVTMGPVHFPGMIYNGAYAGPVLRVHAGDWVHIRLVNKLTEPTNLHFHGLRVTPLGSGDNMHLVVQPGQSFDYRFEIPELQPPGLFWYHDHLHEMTAPHVTAGLGGAILVEGFAGGFGGLDGIAQKLVVMKDASLPGCKDTYLKTELHCRVVSINGKTDWRIVMRPGETQLWRLCNQGADLQLHLSLPGAILRVVGRDGTPTLHAADVTSMDVMPAARLDVLVTAPASGLLPLLTGNVLTGHGKSLKASRQVGTVTVAGLPSGEPPATPVFQAQFDLRTRAVTARRLIVFSSDLDKGLYFINGLTFDHNRVDVRVPLGSTEEWTIRNETEDFHEFHIHQMGFQVVELNGAKRDFDGYVDDVDVPARGEVKLLLPFTDPVMLGQFMFHCHVLTHEDHGMMANIEVYRPDAPPAPHICRLTELR